MQNRPLILPLVVNLVRSQKLQQYKSRTKAFTTDRSEEEPSLIDWIRQHFSTEVPNS